MPYIFDGILVLILIIGFFIGSRKGLVQSLIDLLGSIASAILAAIFSGPISTAIYESFMKNGLYERVYELTDRFRGEELILEVYEPLPDFVKNLLEEQGISRNSLILGATGTDEKVTEFIVDAISPVFVLIINFFVVILLFLIIMIAISAIGKLISPILNLPVLSQIDGTLGGVFGLVFAIIIMWVVLTIIHFLSFLLSSDQLVFFETTVNSSFIFKFFVNFNPFTSIIM